MNIKFIRVVLWILAIIFVVTQLPVVTINSIQEYIIAVLIALYIQPWVIDSIE